MKSLNRKVFVVGNLIFFLVANCLLMLETFYEFIFDLIYVMTEQRKKKKERKQEWKDLNTSMRNVK